MTSNTKLVIFDWDGTLFNSVGNIVLSLQYAAQHYQIPLDDESAKSIIGLGLPEVMQTLFPHVPELHQGILERYAEHYVENSQEDEWFEGVAEMLHQLKDHGFRLAVATGKSRRGLDRVLKKTQSEQLFEITRAASETKSKPHPLMLQEILAFTGLDAQQAIMVGDTSYDLEMAKNIAMPRIGVSYGVHAIDVLKQYHPVKIAHSVADLHQSLLKINND
ncbi:MAG: HAD-IA family hydrolase [Acinetobacter sp.]